MRRGLFCTIILLPIYINVYTQGSGFPFGQVSLDELGMKTYGSDTSAVAVVLKEFGEAYVDTENGKIIFEFHTRIKILRTTGLKHSDFSVSLYKGSNGKIEVINSIKASTFNLEAGKIQETKADNPTVYTENLNKYYDLKKFVLPNVRVGSVIEVQYTLESPFIYNFRTWEFQSEIPKIQSEFWAKIPGNYVYNVRLSGYLKLVKNESTIVKECIKIGSGIAGVYSADCALNKYGMKNIPAFIEEDYMTAKRNFLSAIYFELSEVRYFDGRIDKVTKEWKDVEDELKKDNRFGGQLKKGKDIWVKIEQATTAITDPTEKARKIHTYIKTWYKWNEVYGFVSDLGIKKAFESKSGSVADINLSLIAALNYGGIKTEPLLISTRQHGLPTEVHPVLSDFNYVVAKVNIDDKVYLLDATDPYLPFGLLPEKCLNGKGRVFAEKGSYWYDLKPIVKDKRVSVLDLMFDPSGILKGTLEHSYYGYKSVSMRKKISSFNTHEEYVEDLSKTLVNVTINKFEISGIDDFDGPIKERFEVEIEGFEGMSQNNFLFNPFDLIGKIERNPFMSPERLYPVDFGAPLETQIILTLKYPSQVEIVEKPESTALSLPSSGGRFLFDIKDLGDKLIVNYSLSINKSVYNSNEYHYLKELFNRVIQYQNIDLVFKKKE